MQPSIWTNCRQQQHNQIKIASFVLGLIIMLAGYFNPYDQFYTHCRYDKVNFTWWNNEFVHFQGFPIVYKPLVLPWAPVHHEHLYFSLKHERWYFPYFPAIGASFPLLQILWTSCHWKVLGQRGDYNKVNRRSVKEGADFWYKKNIFFPLHFKNLPNLLKLNPLTFDPNHEGVIIIPSIASCDAKQSDWGSVFKENYCHHKFWYWV